MNTEHATIHKSYTRFQIAINGKTENLESVLDSLNIIKTVTGIVLIKAKLV